MLTCNGFTVLLFACLCLDKAFIFGEFSLFNRDYGGLKTQLGNIRAKALQQVDTSSSFGNTDVDHTHHPTTNIEEEYDESEEDLIRGNATSIHIENLWASGSDPTTNGTIGPGGHGPAPSMRWRTSNQERIPSFSMALAGLTRAIGPALNAPSQQTPLPLTTHPSPVFPPSKNLETPTPPNLHTILSNLPVTHAKFFDMLDAELGKIATFYAERGKEMRERAKLLKRQLNELAVHRQMFHESSAHSKTQSWAKRAYLSVPLALSSMTKWLPYRDTKPEEPHQTSGNGILASEPGRCGRRGFGDTSNLGARVPEHMRLGGDHSGSRRRDGVAKCVPEKGRALDESVRLPLKHLSGLPSVSLGGTKHHLDPNAYRQAKRRLRKAVAEYYRGLEALNNYRILNLTGFRKALKKYEKITKISVQDAYMKEKVEPSAFGSGATVGTMLKEMEHLYAMRFGHGDRKRAKNHLRAEPLSETHDFITFRSGLWLGLAVPAIAAGCYLSLDEYTRTTLRSWNILLFIYSILLVPVLMGLLIGVNVLVWVRNRINYVFIFKLDPKSKIHHREYFELPSFLLCTLAYGFWFSMAQLGPPVLWPLIWLVLAIVVMFNPLRSFMWGSTRWWTIKKIAKLGASGIWNVEFTDLWLGDQFCSLVYPISNLYFVGCFYTHSKHLSSAYDPQAQEVWSTCGIAQNWGWYYFLGSLPFQIRFVQCLRRYRDSKLPGQLVNAGKYGMGMVQYFFYCYWRHHGSPHIGKSYILWCFTATVNSLYACAWDTLIDWSMGRPYSQYPLLRQQLVYESHIPWYYFALVFNLSTRFIWLIYIFFDEQSIELRTFIAAMLEMLRRVQWNLYRVENKHLSNTMEYRITREVPLPYSFDVHPSEEEAYIARLQLRKRLARLS